MVSLEFQDNLGGKVKEGHQDLQDHLDHHLKEIIFQSRDLQDLLGHQVRLDYL